MTYVDGKAVPVPELITDKRGSAISPELPYGLYVVEESTVPENLKAVDPFWYGWTRTAENLWYGESLMTARLKFY